MKIEIRRLVKRAELQDFQIQLKLMWGFVWAKNVKVPKYKKLSFIQQEVNSIYQKPITHSTALRVCIRVYMSCV